MQLEGYTTDDFVMDACFQEWVQHPTRELDAFWHKWIMEHPQQRQAIADARSIIESMPFEHKTMPAHKATQIWAVLERTIASQTSAGNNSVPPEVAIKRQAARFVFTIQRVAAGLTGILVVALAYFLLKDWTNTSRFTTDYGETKKITLPDGSVVTLNANSTLSFAEDWSGKMLREVWLDGEAFFSVVHTVTNQKFIVHTDDFLQVEVLGTEFDVSRRKKKTRVVLQSGSIKLNISDSNARDQPETSFLMKPGELVEFDEASERYIKKEVDPEVYSSWKTSRLLLDRTSLQEILQQLETNYGFEIRSVDSDLLNIEVSGSIPLGDTDILLQRIAQTFEVKISRSGNELTVRKSKNLK
jgi:transmembrane sensor